MVVRRRRGRKMMNDGIIGVWGSENGRVVGSSMVEGKAFWWK